MNVQDLHPLKPLNANSYYNLFDMSLDRHSLVFPLRERRIPSNIITCLVALHSDKYDNNVHSIMGYVLTDDLNAKLFMKIICLAAEAS